MTLPRGPSGSWGLLRGGRVAGGVRRGDGPWGEAWGGVRGDGHGALIFRTPIFRTPIFRTPIFRTRAGVAGVREEFKRPALKAGVAWHDIDGAREVNVIQQEVREAVDAIRLARKENSPGRVKPLWL